MHVETLEIKKMSSRRLMNRSLSSDGRSYYGASDITSNRRSGSRSYLSSARSESRNTLCSVMAQLTEDTQPTFESTLKSKAVSEDANVKFNCVVSGYPVPEVTWYKDDIQLDRYCGLPKYEISRNDKTHTLQIYNCTLEDAAIYQASAQNSRGIVSCSGVLEVGTMSEYKIHQNYFAKLKLRNENRRQEQEEHRNIGKENVPAAFEHDRMSSPERAQRKRRSMEALEEKAVQVETSPVEDRLAAPVQVSAAGLFHGISNSEMIANRDKDSEGLMYIHETVHSASSKQTNEHYIKKKLKISTAATEKSKENRPTGRGEEMMNERGTSSEKMEVQNTVDQIASVTESRNKMDITDTKMKEKQSGNVNKCPSNESRRAQGAQIASVIESRNEMDITDTKMNVKQSVNVNKSASNESRRAQGAQITKVTESTTKMGIADTKMNAKQSLNVNRSASEESRRAQGAQITTVTESTTKMDITDTKINVKQSVNVNKSASEESRRAQGAQITRVTESTTKMDITDTKMNAKQSLNVNKSASEESRRAQGTQIASVTESRNKMDITDTKINAKQSLNVNKSASEESRRAQGAQIASVTESTAKMDITDTKMNAKQSLNVNKSASEESRKAQGAQIASVTESTTKMDITDTKMNAKQSLNVNKSASEESRRAQGAQIASVTESTAKMDITDTKMNAKQSLNVNKSASEESRKAQGAQIASVTESTAKMDITDTKMNAKQSLNVNKSASEESRRAQGAQIASVTESTTKMDITDTKMNAKQSLNVNKSASEESRRAQGTQIASVTESTAKMDITDTKMNAKQSLNVNKSASEESRKAQGAQIASVTESRNKMDITDTKMNAKQSLNVNKSASEESRRAQGAQIVPVTESRNKMDITDTKMNVKQSLNVNKSASEESMRAQGTQIASVTESRNKMDITDTKMNAKQSLNVNKSASEESRRAQGAQIVPVTESRNKMDITDTKMNVKQSLNVNKSASEESMRAQGAQIASVTESRNKMDIKDTKMNAKQSLNVNKSPSKESKRAQDSQITSETESRNKMDITYRKSEKLSENAQESPSESQRGQKPIGTQKRPALKVSMITQTSKVVEITKQTESSEKGTSNLKLFDDHENRNPVSTCVRILPHSCGGNDVDVDTGERNVACTLRGLAAGDTQTEPKESPILEDIPPFHKEVAKKLKEQPPLMREVTASVTDTLSSCQLASQGQKLRAGDQSAASTKSSSLVTGPQNKPSEKISSGHVSHMLHDGQVTKAMSSSLGDDTLTSVCEKDSEAGSQLIKESDKPKGETKPASMSFDSMEKTEMTNINTSTNVQVQNSISKEKSTANSNHSTNQVIVTEFVQICKLNSNVVQPQTMNSSSITKVEMKDTKARECQSSSLGAINNVSKMDTQEQSKDTTFEVPVSTHNKMQSYSDKKRIDRSGPSTFLSQHSKALPTEFTIPAIYITDVDGTSQNSTDKTEHIVCKSAIIKSDTVKITTEANAVTYSNTDSQTSIHSDCTDTTNKTTAVLEFKGLHDEKCDLSLRSQTPEVNKPDQQPLSQESLIQGPESSSHFSTEKVSTDFIRLSEVPKQHPNADKSIKSELTETTCHPKTDLNLKTDSDSFIKQLKSAALDLEMSDQRSTSTMINAATHINSRDKDKLEEEVNSAVIQHDVCKVTIPLKKTDHQDNSTAAQSELATRTNQKTTLPSPTAEMSEIGMTICLEEGTRDAYQKDSLSLKTQPESPLQSVSNSQLKTSLETHSPRLTRKIVPADLDKPAENENVKPKSTEKVKETQFKVPQIIRKIRPEVFDASGHLKLWCQFFNIVSDSTIRWYKDEVEIAEIKRSAGDETQVCLAILRMSKRDCGVYKCTITNDYGKDSTEYLLSAEFLSNMFLREELKEVGEEIEMTPLIFSKGLADAGCWGSKFYGRVTTEEAQVGIGCEHKTRRLKVIYGLDPVFESGSSCFLKVRSPIAYESREETVLAERNLQITKQECRIQNMAREYFKIFAAETRVIESFGAALEVIPLYFMYCPASSVPYATVEAELKGVYKRYCGLDRTGSLVLNEKLEVGQKCSSLQHWIHQWTNGNVLFSRLEGVDTILTNVGIAIRSKGYQGFPCEANPKIFELFHIQHQCNYFCGLLNLKPLKAPETLQALSRSQGSSSPLLQRRPALSSSSPQTSRKATKSPKVSRKLNPQT
ncbi:alpha-protein kinase [Pimephales promelas]|nr:alpha-protein kinase [Pimephales promelas]